MTEPCFPAVSREKRALLLLESLVNMIVEAVIKMDDSLPRSTLIEIAPGASREHFRSALRDLGKALDDV